MTDSHPSSPQPDTDQSSSDRFQFGLGWLLAAVTFAGVFLGVWRWSPEAAVYGSAALGLPVLILLVLCFPARKPFLEAIGGAVLLAVVVFFLARDEMVAIWDTNLPIHVTVVDETTGDPIPEATVQIADRPGWAPAATASARTDHAGQAIVHAEIETVQRKTVFQTRKSCRLYSQRLIVEGGGCEATSADVTPLVPADWKYGESDLKITVRLPAGNATAVTQP